MCGGVVGGSDFLAFPRARGGNFRERRWFAAVDTVSSGFLSASGKRLLCFLLVGCVPSWFHLGAPSQKTWQESKQVKFGI